MYRTCLWLALVVVVDERNYMTHSYLGITMKEGCNTTSMSQSSRIGQFTLVGMVIEQGGQKFSQTLKAE